MSSPDAATAATLLGVGVRTRAQKRRRGDESNSSLWDVVVKCDDITFTHILPRLNATDVKFLHGVNSETRKLIKRSSRKKELKEKFKVEEMSSISTLEVAWEHFPWDEYDYDAEEEMDETYFCWKVAQTNKLELLKWAREEKKCDWDVGTINRAAEQGNLEMVKYCVVKKCPIGYVCVCTCCPKRSSRGTQILTRRSQSALGFGHCRLGGSQWSSPHTRISC